MSWKVLKYVGIGLLVAFCLFSMLDPVNWPYIILALVIGTLVTANQTSPSKP
jgi:sorbitol-specific phosphotransferase system component IIBC